MTAESDVRDQSDTTTPQPTVDLCVTLYYFRCMTANESITAIELLCTCMFVVQLRPDGLQGRAEWTRTQRAARLCQGTASGLSGSSVCKSVYF